LKHVNEMLAGLDNVATYRCAWIETTIVAFERKRKNIACPYDCPIKRDPLKRSLFLFSKKFKKTLNFLHTFYDIGIEANKIKENTGDESNLEEP